MNVTHDFSNFDLKKMNSFLLIFSDNNSAISLKSGSLINFQITQVFLKSSIHTFFQDLTFSLKILNSSTLISDHLLLGVNFTFNLSLVSISNSSQVVFSKYEITVF